MKKVGKLAVFSVIFASSIMAAGAVSAETDVERRSKAMKSLKENLGPIVKVAGGEKDYDPSLVGNAKLLVSVGQEMLSFFPEGSGGGKTRAKLEIWQDWPAFEAKVDDYRRASGVLLTAVERGDAAEIGDALGGVGKACKGCHKPFRAPKEN